ncbi:MAG: hypothetical protein JWR37_2091 [Mycobacterium sp.]|nr:hypothetical protein [Mycobacterium sp.]
MSPRVSTPAYRDTSVGLRSLAEHVQPTLEDVIKYAKEDELRKFLIRTDGGPSRRALSGVEAKARLLAKAPKPMSPAVARMRLLAKKHGRSAA